MHETDKKYNFTEDVMKNFILENPSGTNDYIKMCKFSINYADYFYDLTIQDIIDSESKVIIKYLYPAVEVIEKMYKKYDLKDTGINQCARDLYGFTYSLAHKEYKHKITFIKNIINRLRVNENNKKNPDKTLLSIKMTLYRCITNSSFEINRILTDELVNEKYKNDRFFKFFGFYDPDGSSKIIAINLLKEAISLLEKDNTLNDKSKEKIINKIKDIISQMESSSTKWTMVLGSLKETIIVLGAVGSIAGGAVALSQAYEKLREVEGVVSLTSINENYLIENKSNNLFIEEVKLIEQVSASKKLTKP